MSLFFAALHIICFIFLDVVVSFSKNYLLDNFVFMVKLARGHEVAYKLKRFIVCRPLLLDVQIRMNDNINLKLYAKLLNRNNKLLNQHLQ
jgi:hypothetical protein